MLQSYADYAAITEHVNTLVDEYGGGADRMIIAYMIIRAASLIVRDGRGGKVAESQLRRIGEEIAAST
jgi:hypothetical protein